ncbi:MAG: UbiA family prenyltransferase, partial [Calditrichaeota bacterium]|nr:UbiA family prenyltransferase [Calditrichota bacterium]
LLGVLTFLSAIVLLIIGFLYNRRFKKSGLLGNLMVSFSVGMTFIYGAISVELPFNKVALVFALIAALVDLGEEIAADAMDMQGDKLIGSNSIAIVYGTKSALRISSIIFSIVIVLSIIPFVLGWFPKIYLIPILIMDVFIAYNTLQLRNTDDAARRKHIRWIYLGATFGLMIFIFMRFLGV